MSRIKNALLAAGLMIAAGQAPAEDIDLFMGLQDAEGGGQPNVLIVIDNTANWNTAFSAEMSALAATISGLDPDKYRIGFMMYSETGGLNGNTDGGYLRAGIRMMDETTKGLYENLVRSFDVLGDKSNNGKLGLAMSEVQRYFDGAAAYGGIKVKRDYAGNAIHRLDASNAIYLLAGNAFNGPTASTYEAPSDVGGCDKSYVIFLSNGKSNSNNHDNSTAEGHLAAVGGNTTRISLSPSGFERDVADEWARYLGNRSENPVTTFVIDVVPTVRGQYSDDYKALLESIAGQGHGSYFNVGSAGAPDLGEKLQDTLNEIFGEIAAVNSVFASAALPVSVNTQGSYHNQVYIGMFRPDRDANPRWSGNLKEYQIDVDEEAELRLADRNGNYAINPITGFITPCAESYWTPRAVDAYWAFKQDLFVDSCPSVPGSAASNSPDGQHVEKGAAGFRLRALAPAARVVKTCNGACGGLADFDTANANITAASLGVSAGDRADLINWARGTDLDDEDGDGDIYEMRPSVHGSILHSRPLAVDYGEAGIAVYYGGEDGMFHAVEGGKASDNGDELWTFVAPEHYGKLSRLRTNEPRLVFPAPEPGTAGRMDHFFDGPVGGYRTDEPRVWIYATMRRGGRRIYAFDVTNPISPALLWRLGCPLVGDDTGCDPAFTGIGQTWSAPMVFKTSAYVDDQNAAKPAAIFGGGYDDCEDYEPNRCVTPKGNHVYVIDTEHGTLIRRFDTLRSVAADVAVIDMDDDKLADTAYAVDTGGNVYRIDMGNDLPTPADWSITRIAALGCDDPDCGGVPNAANMLNRKFLYGPEIVVTNEYNVVLVGTGDREHPLDTNQAIQVDNAFFMIKDRPNEAAWLPSEHTNCGGQDLICLASLTEIAPDAPGPDIAVLNASKGWYLAFGTNAEVDGHTIVHDAEQVVTGSVVVGGILYFSTHTPTANTQELCGPNLGTARAYAVNFLTAASPTGDGVRFTEMVGGGLPPSPLAGMVEIDDNIYPFIVGGRQFDEGKVSSPQEAGNPGINVAGVKTRSHWYIEPPEEQ